jgi:organic radical activating enzyme
MKLLYGADFTKLAESLYNSDKPLVIWGGGELGRRAVLRMDFLGLKEKIVCVGDSNPQKAGTRVEGICVMGKEEILSRYPDARMAITVGSEKGESEARKSLEAAGFKNFISRQAFLHRYEFDKHREKALARHGEKYILRQAVVCVTEKCTLRCKNCSQLMPRIKEPVHRPAKEVVESIKRLADMVTYMQDVCILGGEPLLHPSLAEICREVGELKRRDKVKFISITTNGTLAPRKELLDVLREYGIKIFVSDYGMLSSKMDDIRTVCENSGVAFEHAHLGGNENKLTAWSDIGTLERQNFSQSDFRAKFAGCRSVYDCNFIYKGRYWFCCFAPFLTEIGICPESDDSFDLLRDDIPFDELRGKWRQFMETESPIEACYYCNPHGVVPVAEQIQLKGLI